MRSRVVAAALLLAIIPVMGCRSHSAKPKSEPSDGPTESATDEKVADAEKPAYGRIAERDIFRPLVVVRKETGSGGGGEGGGGSAQAGKPGPAGPPGGGPGATPDPLADIALTGVTEVDQRPRALLESISTRRGSFVGLGDMFAGFRVTRIYSDSVVLARGEKTYTVRMGAKDVPDAPGSAAKGPEGPQPSAASAQAGSVSTGASAGAPSMAGGFGANMLAWAEKQPLSTLERMFGQYSSFMPAEQRAQAQSYLEDRRRREGR